MNTKMRVKTYEQIKKEQEAQIKQKQKAIKDIIVSAKNNPKFAKLLSYSFTSLNKMITPPNSDARLNAKLIMEQGGIDVLRSIAQKNPNNEELRKQIADIILKLTSLYDNVDLELSQKFVESKGHEAVMEMLSIKHKGAVSVPLIKCLNNLCQIPQLIDKLLNSGIADTIKLVNDLYSDDPIIIRMNLDIMKRISNQKNGRQILIKKGIVPSLLLTIKNCCKRNDASSVFNGLIVVDNLCRNEEGKKEVKNSDAPLILCDIVENFSESAKIINKSAKILAKIMTKEDLQKELEKLKKCSEKLNTSDKQEIINEIKDSLALVSNLMLVDELRKVVGLSENFKMLTNLFDKLCKIDLSNKNPGYVKDYIQTKKHFLTLFKRAFDYKQDLEIEEDDIDQGYTILYDKIHDCIKKNWDSTKKNVEKLEKEGDKDGDLPLLKNAFKGFFTSYNDIIKQSNDRKTEEEKKDKKWVELLNYITGDVIFDGKKYFGKDEKPNYAASNTLKIANDIVINNLGEFSNLEGNLKKCFPYIKNVIGFSDNWRTLANDLDVISNTLKNEPNDSEFKRDIIPVITKFMEEKYKFRYPNLINLTILDEYLNPEFISQYLSKKPDIKSNPNLALNYVKAVNSVMAKPFYKSSILTKKEEKEDELDKNEDEDQKEPKNDDIENKILVKGSNLLKRLIPLEEYLNQIKDFKKNANHFNPEGSKQDDILKLEDNLIYQHCALNVDEFFNSGMNEVFTILRDLIRKEISFIESFKRLKSNENNPKYKDICEASNRRLKMQLGTLRKLEDQGIDKFCKTKGDNYKKLLQNIIDLNSEIISKSTDGLNLIDHLVQLRNNIAFLRNNEEEFIDEKNKTPSEIYISSLMKLLNKSLNDENLCDYIIKTLISLVNKKPNLSNLLVKSGCPRLLLQIMEKTQNKNLANDAMELLKIITLSSEENAAAIGNQNILMKLFEIRSKFATVDTLTKNADLIANELMKLPGQGKFIENFIKDAIKQFHENLQKDFNNDEIKQKILNNEEIINSFTSNSKAIQPILDSDFIKDLNKACDLVSKDQQISLTVDKLLTNDIGILKKIKDNLPSKDDEKHSDVCKNILKIITNKSNFEEPLLLSCKCLSDYVKDDVLYKKHLLDKINEGFVDKLFEIQENYLDNPEIIKEINNILCYLSLRSPKLAECIIKRGGLANIIEELKGIANLNDPNSQLLKLNGLKMLNSLLNNSQNLEEFLKSGGVDLINKIVKNEVDITPKTNDDNNSPDNKYLTKGTIFTKTPEQLKEEEKLGINSFTNLGISKEEADKKRAQFLQDLNEDKSKDSTSSEEENSDDSDNYFVQCLKIINKGLDNGKNEFVDENIVKNLTNLASSNFPDKNLFKEVATILSNKNVKLNPEAVDDLKDLMKLGLSSKAQYYGDGNVGKKVKAIEEKIANMLMNDLRYKTGFKDALLRKGLGDNKLVPGKLSDDRWGDIPKRKDDDNERPIPGKLSDDRWKNIEGKKDNANDNKKIPGKLKNPFGNEKKSEDDGKNNNKNLKSSLTKGIDNEKNEENQDKDLQEKNKLLTYLSLTAESENLKKLLGDMKPEICAFFNNLHTLYKPVIDKILNDKEKKINDIYKKNLLDRNTKKDNTNLIEPFNLNSLSEKERYDSGVVLALAKLYNYILDEANKEGFKPIPGKLNDDRWGDMPKRNDDANENRPLPGKLKNPFEGNNKGENDNNNNKSIPGKLKNPFGKEQKEKSGLNKFETKRKNSEDDDDEKFNGDITPEEPINKKYVNNLEIMADPVYTPENYIFVNQFNKEMDEIMNKLGKYEEEGSPEDDKNEVTDNYLTHLSNLFNRAVPFLEDLHREINSSPTGTYPDIKKEKEDNFDQILTATENYYKTDQDNDIKSNNSKNICDACLNLIDDFSKDGIIDKEKEKGGKPEKLKERTSKLWDIVNYSIKNDENNQILEPSNNHRVRDMIKKINDSINNKGHNIVKMRYIPFELSNKLENGEDKLGQDLLDFAMDDLEKHGDEDEGIKETNYKTIAKLSKFPGLMKQIMKNPKLWKNLINEYSNPKLINKRRGIISTILHNCSLSNYNIENMIKNEPEEIKTILHKMINEPITTLDDGGREIAETEVATLCEILKDKDNYKTLLKGNIINDDDIKKLDNLYNDLDPKISEPLKPILSQIHESDKSKKEKEDLNNDEKEIKDLQKRIGNCYENHKRALINYLTGNLNKKENNRVIPGKLSDDRWGDMPKRKEDDYEKRPLPGKLKNPFDNQNKEEDSNNNRNIPGKLKNPFDNMNQSGKSSNKENDLLRQHSSLRKMSFASGALYFNQADIAKIKSSLSTIENPEISNDINQIISLLRKNYNDMKNTEDPELNIQRADNIHKCLNLLKQISLAPDNHKPILEGGFMSFMENLDNDYKLFKKDGEPDLNNKNLGFEINSKNVLQACSNSENAIPIIAESPVFDSTINEVTQLYEKPELIASNSDIQKLFLYDNVIFSNLCKNKTYFDSIFNKVGLDKLLSLGKKTGNVNILESTLNMLYNYIKNSPNKDEIPPEILDSTFSILDKCINIKERTPALMSKVLDISSELYTDKLKSRVNNLNLIKSMNDDIDNFKNNHGYIISCLNALNKLSKDNPENGQEIIDCQLLKKLNEKISDIIKEGPEKYEENKNNNEEDENGYLKTCYNLAKLYNNLIKSDKNNADKFNRMGITDNIIQMLNHFNDIIEPLTDEEKNRIISEASDKDNVDNKQPKEMVFDIMKYNIGTLDQITEAPKSNEFLSTSTTFSDTITKTIGNEKNDIDYMITALHALGNHLSSEENKELDKLDLQNIYSMLKEMQSKYYSNPEILKNINYIAANMVKNLKNDNKGKEFTKKFYELLPESTKLQDYNPDLVNNALKLMYDGLTKKPYLIEEVYEETVPNLINLLKLYKDNPEIQENAIKILSLFAKIHVYSSAMINSGLLDIIREIIENAFFSDGLKELKGLSPEIYKLLNLLSSDQQNCPRIADEMMNFLISSLNGKGNIEEKKEIITLLNTLEKNKQCVPPFVQYGGIDACVKILQDNDSDIDVVSNILDILKNISNTSDEYKNMLKQKNVPDLINRIIKKVGGYDKKIDLVGRQLLLDINLTKIELEDPNSIVIEEIKIEEPIPPEVRNFLTNGKQVKIINDNGDVKQMQLIFSQDLMKISAKKLKSNLPPKPKYIIDTITVKKVLKGHGTEAFKKSKGMFRKIPPPEICFSIIGPTSLEGMKSLNVECENEKEVDKWIKYISIVINYFKKTKAIKSAVTIKK